MQQVVEGAETHLHNTWKEGREKDKECESKERSEEREERREIGRIDTEEQIQTRKERRVIVKWKVGCTGGCRKKYGLESAPHHTIDSKRLSWRGGVDRVGMA